ncbi:hypothetical protein MHYP_G00020770 [Metynnis hypsauchen]
MKSLKQDCKCVVEKDAALRSFNESLAPLHGLQLCSASAGSMEPLLLPRAQRRANQRQTQHWQRGGRSTALTHNPPTAPQPRLMLPDVSKHTDCGGSGAAGSGSTDTSKQGVGHKGALWALKGRSCAVEVWELLGTLC